MLFWWSRSSAIANTPHKAPALLCFIEQEFEANRSDPRMSDATNGLAQRKRPPLGLSSGLNLSLSERLRLRSRRPARPQELLPEASRPLRQALHSGRSLP